MNSRGYLNEELQLAQHSLRLRALLQLILSRPDQAMTPRRLESLKRLESEVVRTLIGWPIPCPDPDLDPERYHKPAPELLARERAELWEHYSCQDSTYEKTKAA